MSDPPVTVFRPTPDQYAWTFGGAPPVARIRPPAVLEVFTEDCFAGRVRSETDLVSEVCEFPYLNPQTGPFYIEGAEPGDTLAVHFVSIEPARDWGASTTVPLFGALSATHTTALLHDPLPEIVWLYQFDRASGTCRFTARRGDFTVDLPLNPMHGTVGVAPANLEVRSALVPDAFGGNMDTPEMRAGVTCYLGVNVEGALFSLGDGHARQGEGETCGVAVETAMNTVLAVNLIKGRPCPWPRLESDTHIMSTGSARPWKTRSASPSMTWCTGWRQTTGSTPSTRTSSSRRPSSLRWRTYVTRTTPAWPRCPSATCPPWMPWTAPTPA
jgi:acetamidase/formamidase